MYKVIRKYVSKDNIATEMLDIVHENGQKKLFLDKIGKVKFNRKYQAIFIDFGANTSDVNGGFGQIDEAFVEKHPLISYGVTKLTENTNKQDYLTYDRNVKGWPKEIVRNAIIKCFDTIEEMKTNNLVIFTYNGNRFDFVYLKAYGILDELQRLGFNVNLIDLHVDLRLFHNIKFLKKIDSYKPLFWNDKFLSLKSVINYYANEDLSNLHNSMYDSFLCCLLFENFCNLFGIKTFDEYCKLMTFLNVYKNEIENNSTIEQFNDLTFDLYIKNYGQSYNINKLSDLELDKFLYEKHNKFNSELTYYLLFIEKEKRLNNKINF